MRLRNIATTKYISCIGCKHYDYGLCKKTHEFELITEKKMYPLASSYRNICGYKNPKHYVSIDLKKLEKQIEFQQKTIDTTLLLTPISMVSMFIGLRYNYDYMFIFSMSSFFSSGALGISSINNANLNEKRLKLIKESKK
jgi:hypothetical protein